MTFKKIFDRNAPINSGLIPIWFVLSVIGMFIPTVHMGGLMPLVVLLALHWLFRFGKWAEFRIRPKKKVLPSKS